MFEKKLGLLSAVELRRYLILGFFTTLLVACTTNPAIASSVPEYIRACIDQNNSGVCDEGDVPIPNIQFEIFRRDGTSMLRQTDENGEIPIPPEAIGGTAVLNEQYIPTGMYIEKSTQDNHGNFNLLLDFIVEILEQNG